MNRITHKINNFRQRKHRVGSRIHGTTERPRLAVFVSNRHIVAQVINDETQKTIAHASTVGKPMTGTMTEKAETIGAEIAKKAKAAKVNTVVFDRSGKLYHGRVKALADSARKAGLEF